MQDKTIINVGHCTVIVYSNGRVTVSYTLTKLRPGVARWMPSRLADEPQGGPHAWRELREEFPQVFYSQRDAMAWASLVNHEIQSAARARGMEAELLGQARAQAADPAES